MVNGQTVLGDKIMGLPTANYTSGTYRGIGSSIWNAENIALEDWMRSEQSANNQAMRDLALQENANAFNAEQAQLQRDFEEKMSSTSYQRAVADMKKAGINPILALSNGGADTPQGATATASGSRSSGSNYRVSSNSVDSQIIGTLFQVGAGLLTKGVGGRMSQTFNRDGELVKTVINSKK